jgi:hypothetical protein
MEFTMVGLLRPSGLESHRFAAALLAALVACLAGQAAAGEPVRMRHTPPPASRAWQPIGIYAELLTDVEPEHIVTADVVVVDSEGVERPVALAISRSALLGEIPAAMTGTRTVSYYLRLVDDDAVVSTSPPAAPDAGVFTIEMMGEEGAPAPGLGGVEVLSPLPGEVVSDSTPEIAALIEPALDEPWDAIVVLDGRDVSPTAEITAELFVFVPAESLSRGGHRVTFSAITGTRRVEESWVFFVGQRDDRGDRETVEPKPGTGGAAGQPERLEVHGRLELGWAAVSAEAVVDAILPYDETNRPSLDFYASGYGSDLTTLLTAYYDPVYDERIRWLASAEADAYEVEAGDLFPSLSATTLDWASGVGGRVALSVGPTRTELVGLRLSEADTLAGFGLYSRFALGAREDFELTDAVTASVVYLHVYDREGSVAEDDRLDDPLRNTVVAGVLGIDGGRAAAEIEVADAAATGEFETSGGAVRARVRYEKDYDNRVLLEYVYSDPTYYSAGSLEHQPGERGAELEFAFRPRETVRASGSFGAFRAFDSTLGITSEEYAVRAYGRVDGSWSLDPGSLRAYGAARYDRTPYESYDYIYSYGAAGAGWRTARLAATASASFSRSRSPDVREAWGVGGELRYDLVPRKWKARVAARWTLGSGDGGEAEYARSSYAAESRWIGTEVELTVEYRLIELRDHTDPDRDYTEHVVRLGLGRSF